MKLPEPPAAVARFFRLLDDAGGEAERRLDQVEQAMSERPFGSAVFGSIIAMSVVTAGIIAFIAVFIVLVTFFA